MDRGSIIIFWEWSSPHFPFYPAFFDQDMINFAYSLVCSFLEMVFPVMSVLSITRGRPLQRVAAAPWFGTPSFTYHSDHIYCIKLSCMGDFFGTCAFQMSFVLISGFGDTPSVLLINLIEIKQPILITSKEC